MISIPRPAACLSEASIAALCASVIAPFGIARLSTRRLMSEDRMSISPMLLPVWMYLLSVDARQAPCWYVVAQLFPRGVL